ncbi:transcriptional regulator marr-type conserved site [Trichococcus palustris]|jgi:DNA-binding MarR family transcriptional regulator|uniref:Transcriptional regulator marr-type conserved site n=1 Tax=Trichococcus palustris TaxID=140314 RepID=A0A143YCQ1_9LACT|nr:MarR family transcriptional regulator [Trichococcus palustris]CZQ85388.1 transcriptional regulator marr-type conserved site [Trichococcus palustris]SFK55770.1 DNA-binding transcriptional regulator, MarR family [Trichococcus palustris]
MNHTNLFRSIGSISRQATTEMNQQVVHFGLDNNLFIYLMRIVEKEGLSQSDLVEEARVDKTTLSRSIKKLEQLGYINKIADATNRKFKRLYATKKGKEVYPELAKLEESYVKNALQNLTSSEAKELINLLSKIDSILTR